MDLKFIILCATFVTACTTCAYADIVIAQVSPFSGPLKAAGEAHYAGAKAVFDRINAEGGISGKKIRLHKEDDAYKPEETLRLFREVAKREKPVAFVNLLGSANAAIILRERLLEELSIPVVGATPGTESSRNPGSAFLFHVQAGDRAQIDSILKHLSTLGLRRISLIFQNNPAGRDNAEYLEKSALSKQLMVADKLAVAVGGEDLKEIAAQLKKSAAQTYVMILGPGSAGAFVRDARAQGDMTPIYGMSVGTAQGIVEKAGIGAAKGVAIAQTSPNTAIGTTNTVRDFLSTLRSFGPKNVELSTFTFAGYVAALVVVDGLKKAGPVVTPKSLQDSLRRVQMDLGGYQIDFTKSNVGASYVDIAVIGDKGFLRY